MISVHQVVLLKKGHLLKDGEVIKYADSSVTLISSEGKMIVVDTAIPSREDYILNALRRYGLEMPTGHEG